MSRPSGLVGGRCGDGCLTRALDREVVHCTTHYSARQKNVLLYPSSFKAVCRHHTVRSIENHSYSLHAIVRLGLQMRCVTGQTNRQGEAWLQRSRHEPNGSSCQQEPQRGMIVKSKRVGEMYLIQYGQRNVNRPQPGRRATRTAVGVRETTGDDEEKRELKHARPGRRGKA